MMLILKITNPDFFSFILWVYNKNIQIRIGQLLQVAVIKLIFAP